MKTRTIHLNDGWRVTEVASPSASPTTKIPWLPASVPGSLHTDLLAAGVIPHPYERMHERDVAWVDEASWVYEKTFQVNTPVSSETFLKFDGLDTIASISLNGEVIGETDNMFIAHEFKVGDKLKCGPGVAGFNTLTVTFSSALDVGRKRMAEYQAANPNTPAPDWFMFAPRAFVRKSQYMYGWDWGPELLSCGLWQSVSLVEVETARLLHWKHTVAFRDDQTAEVTFTATVHRSAAHSTVPLKLSAEFIRVGNEEVAHADTLPQPAYVVIPNEAGESEVSVTLSVENPRLWWPNRHNPEAVAIHPDLYTVDLVILDEHVVDQLTAKIGLRTIELVQDEDEDQKGRGFKFRINGEDIFAKGANWIPADSFPGTLENQSGRTSEDLQDSDSRVYNLIWAACDAGYNMLRVWGGGIYESDHFYELCDEHGILVWQDFAFACAFYPETEVYAENVRKEAVGAVRRLRNHASLCLWCGNNENNMFWEQANPQFLGNSLYLDVLPKVVSKEDPNTQYWISSPYGGEDPNSPDFGDRHNWDVWHGVGDWVNYAADNSRFVSEFGFASSCGLNAWETCLSEEDKDPYSPVVKWHDKTRKGYDTYLGFTELHYPKINSFEDMVYYTQANQADALKFGIEHYRRLKGRCWGTLFWQFNDCWPVQSWSVVDSLGEPKAAYYASRSFFAPVLLSLVRTGNSVDIHLTNDRLAPLNAEITILLCTFNGEVLSSETISAEIAKNGTGAVGKFGLEAASGRESEVFVYAEMATAEGEDPVNNIMWLVEPKDLSLTEPEISIEIHDNDEDTLRIVISSTHFCPYVWLSTDGVETEFEDNFFHLLPEKPLEVLVAVNDDITTPEELEELLNIRSMSHVQ